MERKLGDLRHTHVRLSGHARGDVFVLDRGALIDAEAEAMLQALYSRSVKGFVEHLEILAKKGPANFMGKFYVGYGHQSIGDCGDTTVFIEGVSMLASKAIQDSMLYRGQESSTRYVDFSKRPFIDPTNTKRGRALLEMQREFYSEVQEPVREDLKRRYPMQPGENEKVYEKAIKARALDITRSLLPTGSSTCLSWHTDLRQASDRLLFLRHHPLLEVRDIAEGILRALREHHPNSFGHKIYPETEDYQEIIAKHYYYHNPNSPKTPVVDASRLDLEQLAMHGELFEKRPNKTLLPKFLGSMGPVRVDYTLDFGSFRDIQRHRAIIQRMPLLTTELGFNEWYIDNFPSKVGDRLLNHLERLEKGIGELDISKEQKQYFIPMGYNVSCMFTGDIPAVVYLVELRDSRFVHPTLQRVAHSIGDQLENKLKIRLNRDLEPSRFDVGRGKHDIVEKG